MTNVHTDTVENADAEEGLDLWASLTQDMTPEEKKTYERLCSEKPEMVQKWLDTDVSMFRGMDLESKDAFSGLPEEGKGKTPEGKAVPTKNAANQQPNVENPPEVDEKLLNELWDRLGLNPTTLVDNCGGKGGKPGPCPKHTPEMVSENDVDHASERVFGKKLTTQDYSEMIGLPDVDKATLEVRTYTHEGVDILRVVAKAPGLKMTRHFYKKDGQIICENVNIHLEKTGTGLGTKIFSTQVSNLAERGFSHIKTEAYREAGEMNGYYTWPLLGYDGKIPEVSTPRPPALRDVTHISHLMKTQEGREWWKTNGDDIKLTFDLNPGSLSRKVLSEYVSKKFGT